MYKCATRFVATRHRHFFLPILLRHNADEHQIPPLRLVPKSSTLIVMVIHINLQRKGRMKRRAFIYANWIALFHSRTVHGANFSNLHFTSATSVAWKNSIGSAGENALSMPRFSSHLSSAPGVLFQPARPAPPPKSWSFPLHILRFCRFLSVRSSTAAARVHSF